MTRTNMWTMAGYAAVVAVVAIWLLVLRGTMLDLAQQRKTCFDEQAGRNRDFYNRQIAACSALIDAGQESEIGLVNAYALRAVANLRAQQFGQAVADLEEAIRRRPDNYTFHYNLSFAHAALYEPEDAIKDLDQVLRLKPDFAAALGRRGMLYSENGQHEKAIADLKNALALAPKERSLYALMGGAYAAADQCETALPYFRKATEMSAKDSWSFARMAGCLLRLQRGDEAIATMDKAVALRPDAQSYRQRAGMQFSLKHYAAAVADLDQVLKKTDEAPYWNDRCWFRAIWGQQLKEALNDCNQALAREPGQPAFLDSRGMVQYRLGDFADAKADYDAALHTSPDLVPSRYMRGLTRLKLGDAGGQDDIALARKAGPKRVEYFEGLGLKP